MDLTRRKVFGIPFLLNLVLLTLFSAYVVDATQLTATDTANQVVLGTTNTLTFSSSAPSTSRTINFPDPGTTGADVLYTKSTQTISGDKTFTGDFLIDAKTEMARFALPSSVFGRLIRTSNTNPYFGMSFNWYRNSAGAYTSDSGSFRRTIFTSTTPAIWFIERKLLEPLRQT